MPALSAAAIAEPSTTPTTPNCRTTTSRTISTEPVMARVRLIDHVVARSALGTQERERDAVERVEEDDRGGKREEEKVLSAVRAPP